MKQTLSLIIGASLIFTGILVGQKTIQWFLNDTRLGAVVQTTDTVNTFRLNFNSLDEYVRSTTSTLGSFTGLATTTGNIPVATSSVGWGALAVGANGRVLTASSTASLGISWEPAAAGAIGTSTAVTTTHFPYWSTARLLNGTSSLQYTISNNLLLFASGASSSQFWSPSSTLTNFRFTNATGTNLDADNIAQVVSTTIRRSTFSVNLIQPSSTTDGNFYKHQFQVPITLSRIDCFDMVGTSTINIERRTSSTPNTAGTAMIGNLACGGSALGGSGRGSTSTFDISTSTVDYVLSFQVITATEIGTTSTLSIIGSYTKQ